MKLYTNVFMAVMLMTLTGCEQKTSHISDPGVVVENFFGHEPVASIEVSYDDAVANTPFAKWINNAVATGMSLLHVDNGVGVA